MATTVKIPGFGRRRLQNDVKAPFQSAEQTGTGAAQNVAHGFAGIPSRVIVTPSESAGAAFDYARGTDTTTNVVLTVTTGEKFFVTAWA